LRPAHFIYTSINMKFILNVPGKSYSSCFWFHSFLVFFSVITLSMPRTGYLA